MTKPTVAWDETSPPGSQSLALGDNRIREMKTQVREIVDVDHKFDSSGQDANMGKHKKVSLLEQADLGTGASGKPILGAQICDGEPELVYTDENDNDIQLTKGGEIFPGSSPTLAKWIEVLKLVYPVGSVYTNASDDTNPATLLGFGTWSAFGAGRVPVGYNSADADFNAGEKTGGAKTVDASHTHQFTAAWPSTSTPRSPEQLVVGRTGVNQISDAFNPSGNKTTLSGGSSTQSIVQSYITVYMWKRLS